MAVPTGHKSGCPCPVCRQDRKKKNERAQARDIATAPATALRAVRSSDRLSLTLPSAEKAEEVSRRLLRLAIAIGRISVAMSLLGLSLIPLAIFLSVVITIATVAIVLFL